MSSKEFRVGYSLLQLTSPILKMIHSLTNKRQFFFHLKMKPTNKNKNLQGMQKHLTCLKLEVGELPSWHQDPLEVEDSQSPLQLHPP